VEISKEKRDALPNLVEVSVAPLLARAIESTHYNRSVSKLFD
jgi:phosphoribosylpyrophosphate synthetase